MGEATMLDGTRNCAGPGTRQAAALEALCHARGDASVWTAGSRMAGVTTPVWVGIREAVELAIVAAEFPCQIRILHGGREADGKRPVEIAALAANRCDRILVIANGLRATEAVWLLCELVAASFHLDAVIERCPPDALARIPQGITPPHRQPHRAHGDRKIPARMPAPVPSGRDLLESLVSAGL
jgi:phosphotransferase system HPr-like phosphotransfer protein